MLLCPTRLRKGFCESHVLSWVFWPVPVIVSTLEVEAEGARAQGLSLATYQAIELQVSLGYRKPFLPPSPTEPVCYYY